MSSGIAEARTAAAWWAQQLTVAGTAVPHPLGDDILDRVRARSLPDPPNPLQVSRFREFLEFALGELIRSPQFRWPQPIDRSAHPWSPFRRIYTDYDADPVWKQRCWRRVSTRTTRGCTCRSKRGCGSILALSPSAWEARQCSMCLYSKT